MRACWKKDHTVTDEVLRRPHNDELVKRANSLPTLDNLTRLYEELGLPPMLVIDSKGTTSGISTRKESMIFMIINLIRSHPSVINPQLQNMKHRCKMRQKSKSLHYQQRDVDRALEYLNREAKPVAAVTYSPALTILS